MPSFFLPCRAQTQRILRPPSPTSFSSRMCPGFDADAVSPMTFPRQGSNRAQTNMSHPLTHSSTPPPSHHHRQSTPEHSTTIPNSPLLKLIPLPLQLTTILLPPSLPVSFPLF